MSIVMGQRIHAKREEYGLSREDLAERLGVSRQTIYQWEAGKVKNIDRDYISRMAKMWNCDPDWLMHMEGKEKVTATYEAPGREPVQVVINNEPILGPASLRAQLYKVAVNVKPENLEAAIEILKSLT
jgi:transcriptional regulator with XRE-family HTH domain